MISMPGDSFTFNGRNFREEFGIRIIKIDHMLPPKRSRKVLIPRRHGLYDYGSECWDERVIRLDCDLVKPLSRAELREVSGLLGRKGKLYLWDEADKYYIGEIYAAPEIFEFPKANIRTFTLEFICEPFAYAETKEFKIKKGFNKLDYKGTTEAPCQIRITNRSKQTIQSISLNALYKRR